MGVNELISPVINFSTNQYQLSFRHSYNLEAGGTAFDGGVLEIKIGSSNFTDIVAAGGVFIAGPYNGLVDTAYGNPLAGRMAWSGNSLGFVTTTVNLPGSTAGKPIQFRWRCGTDNGNSGQGWWVDTVAISETICLCCGTLNTPPVLPAQTTRTLAEGTTLAVTNTAMDADVPANVLSYALLAAPAGASISTNGIITWTPLENEGPSTNSITTQVTDNGVPPLSSANTFTVIVTEVNNPPTLPNLADQTIAELTTLRVTNTAADPDLPPNNLTYILVEGPTNAAISSQGIITWTPTEAQAPGTNRITTQVSDNGQPPFTTTNTFLLVATEVNSAPQLPPQLESNQRSPCAAGGYEYGDGHRPAGQRAHLCVRERAHQRDAVLRWNHYLDADRRAKPHHQLVPDVVTDNGLPALSATNSFTVEVNADPVI